MNELVTQRQADLLFTLLPLVGVVLGAVMALAARRKSDKRAALAAALGWGVPLVLLGVLWRVYNAITEKLGLDTVANLAANAALFVVVGVVCGVVWARLAPERDVIVEPVNVNCGEGEEVATTSTGAGRA